MSITRRNFIKGTALTGVTTALTPTSIFANEINTSSIKKHKNYKNILIITADQLSKKAVSGYGNDFVKTTAIDTLINNGTKFENTYCAFPLCAPSRACFWTGKLPHQTGVIANSSPNIPISMHTIGNIFSNAGYECVHFGKQHDYGSLNGFNKAPQIEKDIQTPSAFPANYDTKEDVYCLSESIKYLENYKSDKPFLMAVEFNNPHNICGWVGEFEGKHGDINGIGKLPPLPENFETDDLWSRSKSVQYACCTHNRTRQSSQWSELNFRQYLKAYYYYVELADKCISKVLATLKNQGLEKDTLIVFFADHGDSMAAHRLVTKMNWFYDETTNVPFVFSAPDLPKNKTLTQLTSLCDLLPTLCDYVGIESPENIYGHSLMPLIKGEKVDKWREEVISEWHTNRETTIQPARMMRTERYKYIIYKEGEDEELYDMQEDSLETKNLSKDPQYVHILEKMRTQFSKYIQDNVDPFFTQEAIIDKRWRSHKIGYQNHTGDSSIDLYLKNIRPLEKSGDMKAVEAARKEIIVKSRQSYYQDCSLPK